MLRFTQGNLLEADVEALVNTVNTVGVMGKGIALMFKERFPDNFAAYEAACRRGDVRVGQMFVTPSAELTGPRWVVNFPTKKHWRSPSKLEWITEGLQALRVAIADMNIRSIAVPPLGSGNGGLEWSVVRPLVEAALGDIEGVDVVVYEPTRRYLAVAKGVGVEQLTPPRALIAEVIHRYGVLGFTCTILEVQKLAWVLARVIRQRGLVDPLELTFTAGRYGPFTDQLRHLLNALDGSYLHCERRLADARPFDVIHVDEARLPRLDAYFSTSAAAPYVDALVDADRLIDGFQSPLGMEALATVDWLLDRAATRPVLADVKVALTQWPGGKGAAARKVRLFHDKLLEAAIARLQYFG